ncbi:MAG: hypothetical protein SP1CHLAM54_13690 [Chlamydiia bacterium]|nr:hypothetical protein [Chlamydiia bacterium]MCH9616262.1 hypothetical protein [Chlamydiia bacterium]MCH9629752.1 hypothetical protein [Chlamydiia bacterium]
MTTEAINFLAPVNGTLTSLDEQLVQAVCDGKSTSEILGLIEQGANVNILMPSLTPMVEPKIPLWWMILPQIAMGDCSGCFGQPNFAAIEKVLSHVEDVNVKVEGISLPEIVATAEKLLTIMSLMAIADYAADREILEDWCDSKQEFEEDILMIKGEAAEMRMMLSQLQALLSQNG